MADELIPGLNANVLMGATDGLTTAFMYILGLALIGGIAWFIQFYLSFKTKCLIEELVDGSSIVRSDKIRLIKEGGVPKWQLWGSAFKFKKDKIPIPRDAFIKMTAKGAKFVTLFKTPAGDYLVVRNSKDMMQKIADYDEFTTGQRAMVIQEYREAMAYKPVDWSTHITSIAAGVTLVLIVVAFLIFFNDTVAPTIKLGEQNVQISQNNQLIQEQQAETIRLLSQVLENIDPGYMQELKLRALQNSSNSTNYIRPPN